MKTLTKVTTTTLSLAFAASAAATPFSANLLTDHFEFYSPGMLSNDLPTIAASNPPPPGGLSGDLAAIVPTTDAVVPRSGTQMVQFLNTHNIAPFTEGSNSDLYYILDLSYYAASLAGGTGYVDMSAWFNKGNTGTNNTFFIGLGSYNEDFVPNDIRLNVTPNRLDDEHSLGNPLVVTSPGWNEHSFSLALHPDTRFLAARIGAHQTTNTSEFLSSFADDVVVTLHLPDDYIPNPQPPSVPASGSTVVFFGTALAGLTFAGKRRSTKKA